MNVPAHVEVCPLCNHRVLVRAKGTFATHYKTNQRPQTLGNQCKASRQVPRAVRALALL